MTGHSITDVTLGLCALVAIAQWIILTSYSGGMREIRTGCIGFFLLALPNAAIGALGYAVRSSLMASTIPLCASVVVAVSLFLTDWAINHRASEADDDTGDVRILFHYFMAWLVVLLTLLLTSAVYAVEPLVRLPV